MEIKNLICIECPRGCELTVTLNAGKAMDVSGNFCVKGKTYAIEECVNPVRTVTTTVRLTSGEMLSVKTDKGVSKRDVQAIAKKISCITVSKPVHSGQVICADIDGLRTKIIATKTIL